MTDDGFCVYWITDKNNQKVKFTIGFGDMETEFIYGLSGLDIVAWTSRGLDPSRITKVDID